MKQPFRFLIQVLTFLLVLVGFGVYDVTRNKALDRTAVRRYFLGNGILTWLLSPFNTLLDLMALPYVNKGVYQLADLPQSHQDEIQRLIHAAHKENLVARLEEQTKDKSRSMIFFKWYGANVDNSITIPAFHEDYRYIKTIGVSVFNKKQSTSKHFGPFRPTLRVLYNINDMDDDSAYIEVGDVKSYWRENKLFIFDDTLQHQSFNKSDKVRYCLFVDILRPAASTQPFALIVDVSRFFLKSVNHIFYKNWDVIKR
ncbi:MAG: aspartyl/asparaginyl beta-hydroxylase domain-containing protein [Cytophagales bacterium]|nr:aspartyl/asparaginyl beta-hydroxylase domain-containing protein [Armatimonadota bacterium]